MSLIKLLEQAGGGQAMQQLAQQFNMEEAQVGQLSQLLAPAIGQATKRRAEAGGLEAVLGQMQGEGQAQLFDDPAAAAAPEGRAQGAAFLEQIMGGADGTQGLAQEAASRSGVDVTTVQEFLPALAGLLQGGMQRNMPDAAIQGLMGDQGGGARSGGGGLMGMVSGLMGGNRPGGSGGGMDLLTNLLDADNDGSVMDDILEKFMR
ncbi:DUF937 domain-containing protein [Actibacterium sp. 188UL27-1]|uniref:DUF937 domain-containing protein n=1 Tax=Actibacterium sp. 188UL27-1 TaxID=2786961 RepID=UPI001957F20B|nr:DUF937 domain-containing protein [Actibacterium sp. 188UL27-1]MBM7066628.1 hypothetical protein [Actibacterium sp. 188UL27-1]